MLCCYLTFCNDSAPSDTVDVRKVVSLLLEGQTRSPGKRFHMEERLVLQLPPFFDKDWLVKKKLRASAFHWLVSETQKPASKARRSPIQGKGLSKGRL